MAYKFRYKDEDYTSLCAVRQAIWLNERVAFGAWNDETKAKFGVETIEYNPQDLWDNTQWSMHIKRQRDSKLSQTDFLVMPDYPLDEPVKKEVEVYRQALRDITLQEGYPKNVVWPEVPTAVSKFNIH